MKLYLNKINKLHYDCLSVLMHLCIMLAYLMLFTASFNAVCFHCALLLSFFALDFSIAIYTITYCLLLKEKLLYGLLPIK